METMKTDKQPTSSKPSTDAERGLPVYEIRFCVQGGRDIGLENQSAGGSGIIRRSERLELTYFPVRRFYRIVETYNDKKKKPKTVYVPEAWATWEPLE